MHTWSFVSVRFSNTTKGGSRECTIRVERVLHQVVRHRSKLQAKPASLKYLLAADEASESRRPF
eukprot:6186560-Pleurochrysis_carterae.AAC.1